MNTDTSSDLDRNVSTVHRLLTTVFSEIDPAAMEAGFRRCATDNLIWVQPSMPTCRSIDEAIGLMQAFYDNSPYAVARIDVLTTIAQGDLVACERIDTMIDKQGNEMASFPITGIFEMNSEGLVTHWREFFDPGPFAHLLPSTDAGTEG